MGKVVSKVFGYDRALNQVEHSVGALQAQGVSTLRDIQGQISQFRQKFENELMPEMNATMRVARDSMLAMVNISQQAVQRISVTLDKVDETVITAKFGIEVILIILFLLIAMLCRYELNRLGNMLKPNAFFRVEKQLLQMLRLACIFSCLAIVVRVFYIVILQHTEAAPSEILYLALLPLVAVITFNALCLLVFVFTHVFYFIRFLMWTPFMVLVYPLIYLLYFTFVAPTVWLYRVYQARLRLKNQYGVYVMHSLVVILPFIFLLTFNVIFLVRGYSYTTHVDVVYGLIATYVLYYVIALSIKINYPITAAKQQVRQVYALRYGQQ